MIHYQTQEATRQRLYYNCWMLRSGDDGLGHPTDLVEVELVGWIYETHQLLILHSLVKVNGDITSRERVLLYKGLSISYAIEYAIEAYQALLAAHPGFATEETPCSP